MSVSPPREDAPAINPGIPGNGWVSINFPGAMEQTGTINMKWQYEWECKKEEKKDEKKEERKEQKKEEKRAIHDP